MFSEIEHFVINNKQSNGRMLADDIVYVYYKPHTTLDLQDFKEGANVYNLLSEKQKLKILVEIGKNSIATPEARRFAQENNPEAIAEAIVIHNKKQRILAKLYIFLHKLDHPMRVLNDKDTAFEWLKSI